MANSPNYLGALVFLLFGPWAGVAFADLRVVGSSTMLPVAQEVALHFAQDAKIRVHVQGGGSDAGIHALLNGKADVAMVSRALKPGEADGLRVAAIGQDGIALIVHETNPLGQLTSGQVMTLFSGRVGTWRELGIAKAGNTVPVLKSPSRATRAYFDRHFGVGSLVPPRAVELGSNLAILLYVSSDPDAVGYVSIGNLNEARRRGLRVKAVTLDGVEPTVEACVERRYALCRPLLLVTHASPPAGALRFIDYLANPAGRAIVERHEFIPVGAASP